MYKFSPKVAHVPNGPIGSPSPSPTSLGLLDLLDAMNSYVASLPTINGMRPRYLTRQLRMPHILHSVNISVHVILCYDILCYDVYYM